MLRNRSGSVDSNEGIRSVDIPPVIFRRATPEIEEEYLSTLFGSSMHVTKSTQLTAPTTPPHSKPDTATGVKQRKIARRRRPLAPVAGRVLDFGGEEEEAIAPSAQAVEVTQEVTPIQENDVTQAIQNLDVRLKRLRFGD